MAPFLFFAYAWTGEVAVPLYGGLIVVGALSGMEIPLIARVLKEIGAPDFRFENVLTVDYVGALVASVAFPLLIIPHLGLMSASLTFGLLNLAVAALSLWLFRDVAARAQWIVCALAVAVTTAALWQSERLVSIAEAQLFEDDVILSKQTEYQQITITRFRDRVRLYLDQSIQFDSYDEHRYHEALVHPAMARAGRVRDVLVLGGGDGMAVREALRHESVKAITLVDLDPAVTALFRDHDDLARLNGNSLRDPRVKIVNADAWTYLETTDAVFDVVILDLPDPKSLTLSKLYSLQFYNLLAERVAGQGVIVTQAGSPVFAREAFWSIAETLRATRNPALGPNGTLHVLPYHTYVPAFGDWGFVMAEMMPRRAPMRPLPDGLRYLTDQIWDAAQVFPVDSGPVDVEVNSIQTHALVGYYLDGWARWFE
jgi:spermidine synthase